MSIESYRTIAKPSEGFYKEKGSKFLAFAFPAENEEQIKEILDELRKKYHDARHHCYAWRLGADKMQFRANDDGEPSNSAGKPILGQIHAKDLTNVLVVVVRYFGGTLLGVGGLIQAYKTSAADALKNATLVKKYIHRIYSVHFPYPEMNVVMKILKDLDIEQFDQKFEMECDLKVKVKKSLTEKFEDSFIPYGENIKVKFLKEE